MADIAQGSRKMREMHSGLWLADKDRYVLRSTEYGVAVNYFWGFVNLTELLCRCHGNMHSSP